MKRNTLAFRLVAGAALLCTIILAVAGFGLSSVFQDTLRRSFDARLQTLLEALVAVTEVDVAGQLVLTRAPGEPQFDQPYSGWYWQVEGGSIPLLRSRSLWDQALSTDPLPNGGGVSRATLPGPDGKTLRVLARRISLPNASGAFVFRVAGDLAEVEDEVARFDRILVWSLGILALGLVAGTFLQVHFGLLPLDRVQRALSDIRRGRTDRLEGRYPGEIEPLVNELNALLDHNAAIVDRARTHVGNLAHALKTPLSVLANEAAAGTDPLAETVQRQTMRMRRQVDHYLARARAAATSGVLGARTPVAPVADDLGRTLLRIYVDRAIDFEPLCPQDAQFRGERQDLEEMVGNLLDNAFKWARSKVRLQVDAIDGRLTVRVEDDGSGIAAGEADRLLQRGERLDEQVPGSGLGLAIVRDIAELYGGSIALQASSLGGLAVILSLPAATDTVSSDSWSTRNDHSS